MISTEVTFLHSPSTSDLAHGLNPECGEVEIEVTMGYEPPDPSVGIMSGGFIDHEFSDTCPACGHPWTDTEQRRIMKLAEQNVLDARPDPYVDER